ncbi:MAG: TraR/DksA C4-type zinc finger protein [Saprospiraceae bacterium]|nr:TraR/DksA C4-type zinc finger protein [Saprospiraceae bacterium]
MNKEERIKIKVMIEQKIIKAEKKIKDYKEMTKPIKPENSLGRLSRMDAINNKSVVEAALRRAEQNLAALKSALLNINKENFGLCQKCECQIPIGRIVLKPESPYCVNCAN